jgi:hypothetical protein
MIILDYCGSRECQCIQIQIKLLLFIKGDGMHFYIVYHSLNNYNVQASFVRHGSEKWCHNITIFYKVK